jgi:hypothetical protein
MNMNIEHFRHLHAVAKQIVDDGSADAALAAALKSATLKLAERYSNPEYALKQLYAGETELSKDLRQAFAIVGKYGDDDEIIEKASRTRDYVGAQGLASAIMDHALDRLSSLRQQHGFEKTAKKDAPMDSIHSIMKSGGIASVCAAIVAKGSTSVSEEEIVSAVGKIAVERWPELSEAQGFTRIYTASSDEARVLQKAITIAKLSPFDIQPTMVGGLAAQNEANDSEQSEASRQLGEMAEKLRAASPWLSADQAFARVFENPKNAVLAAKAHRRPSATTSFAFPR